MKNVLMVIAMSVASFGAQAKDLVCNDGAAVVKGSVAVISDKNFVATVKSKLSGGLVFIRCSGYCNGTPDGWQYRASNELSSGTTIELDANGNEVVQISGLNFSAYSEVRDGNTYKGFYTGPGQYTSGITLRNDGADVSIEGKFEQTGSHTLVSTQIQHWWFDSCK